MKLRKIIIWIVIILNIIYIVNNYIRHRQSVEKREQIQREIDSLKKEIEMKTEEMNKDLIRET